MVGECSNILGRIWHLTPVERDYARTEKGGSPVRLTLLTPHLTFICFSYFLQDFFVWYLDVGVNLTSCAISKSS